jgi:hypothetical protein
MATFITKMRCAYRRLVPVRHFNSELWPLISYAVNISNNNRFRTTSLQLLARIQRNFIGTFKTKKRCAYPRFVLVRHLKSELWPLISYAYWAIIVSTLLLCNYWLEFNKALWESSIVRGDAHIGGLFRSDSSTQNYCP